VGALLGLLAADLGLFAALSYWDDAAPFVVALALVGAAAWPTRLRPLVGSAAALLGVLWLAVAFTPLSRALTRDLVRREAAVAADAVVVLSSNLQDDGDATPSELARLLKGIELVAEGRSTRLVVTELSPPAPSHADTARAACARLNVACDVVSTGLARNTHDEAVGTAALFAARGWKRLLLVTSPTHSRRASAVFEAQKLEVVSVPCAETRYDLEKLEKPRERLDAFASALHERLGLWVYARRGWI
jgi:uncharacterized SAM-binding protein YcdF (DUF218 family)